MCSHAHIFYSTNFAEGVSLIVWNIQFKEYFYVIVVRRGKISYGVDLIFTYSFTSVNHIYSYYTSTKKTTKKYSNIQILFPSLIALSVHNY